MSELMGKQRIQAGFSRRSVLGAAAGLTAASSAFARSPSSGEQPNILWLVSEDNNPFIGAYGDPVAHTPTIDGLAKKGVLYRNVYSNAPVCAPSRFGILTGIYPESCAPANQMRAEAKLPPGFKTYPELMRETGYFCTNNSKTDYNCDIDPASIWDVQGHEGHWRQRPEDRPFLAVFNYETTHESRLFRPAPGRVTPDMVRLPAFLPDTPGIRQDYASYYNLMEKMDGQLADRLAELEADGLADDTIVIHYSDNGGVLGRSKRYCYEEGLRCAMVVYAPPKWRHLLTARPGSEIATPVSFIDLAPTLLSIANIPQPAQMRGTAFLGPRARPLKYAYGMRNRMDERIDFQRTVTDGRWRYIRNYMPHRPWGQHQAFEWLAKGYQEWEAAHLAGTLTQMQDRFFQTKPYEELYDLKADPDEVDDLARNPSAAATLAKFRKLVDEQMIAIRDNGFLPETMEGEGYVESRNTAYYPLKQVMALGAMAAKGDPADLHHFVEKLSSQVPVLRYWAATGLLILGTAAAPAAAALEKAMREDKSPFVRLVSAEAVAKIGDGEEPVRLLAEMIDNPPSWQAQLHALNALTFIDRDAAKAALETVRRAAGSEQEFVRNAGRYLQAVLEGVYEPSMPIFDIQRMMRKLREEGTIQ